MTSSSARPRSPVSVWRLAIFVCAVIVGLLGMHALAMSCGVGQPMTVSEGATSSAPRSDPGGSPHVAVDQHPESTNTPTSTSMAHEMPDPGGSTSVMLVSACVVVLMTALLLLAATAGVLLRRGWRLPRLTPTDVRWSIPPTRRPPTPLTLPQLGLLRC